MMRARSAPVLPMNEISELRLFVRIVEAGGLSAAARKLDSSPAVMSRALAKLEDRLGVRLVRRTSRRFDLTDEGRQLYERGAAILQELDEVEAEVSATVSSPRGQITLVAPAGFGKQVVAPLLVRFAQRHPRVSIHLILSDAGLSLNGPSADLVLTTRLPNDGTTIARKIHADRRILCASPEYLKRQGRPRDPRDLERHNCLCLIRGQQIFNTWTMRVDGAPQEIRVRGRMSASSTDVLRDWVLAGQGIGFLAMWDIHDALQSGAVEECLADHWCDQIDLYAAYPSRRYLPSRVRLFLDFLISHLPKLPANPDPMQKPPETTNQTHAGQI
jgi:DNA-binding transcriptional LysR family regulator